MGIFSTNHDAMPCGVSMVQEARQIRGRCPQFTAKKLGGFLGVRRLSRPTCNWQL